MPCRAQRSLPRGRLLLCPCADARRLPSTETGCQGLNSSHPSCSLWHSHQHHMALKPGESAKPFHVVLPSDRLDCTALSAYMNSAWRFSAAAAEIDRQRGFQYSICRWGYFCHMPSRVFNKLVLLGNGHFTCWLTVYSLLLGAERRESVTMLGTIPATRRSPWRSPWRSDGCRFRAWGPAG